MSIFKLPILDHSGHDISGHDISNHVESGAGCCATETTKLSDAPVPAMLAERAFAGNVAIVSLGCSKNTVDSEVILGSLQKRGFRAVSEPTDADLIVVNTCAFLQSAVKEGIDTILDLAKLKVSARCRKLVVAGCLVERYRDELIQALPEVDTFISTDELLRVDSTSATTSECFDSARRPYFLYDETMPRTISTGGHTAYVKISEGCDRPCTFCIIPKIRGQFRSRTEQSVVAEIEALARGGVKEVILLGQDLTAYGNDFARTNGGEPSNLLSLLRKLRTLETIAPEFWLRLLYAYPIGVTPELIAEIRESPVVCKYLDLPLQHISHEVLKRMRRPLGERRTRELIEMIRTEAPEISLRTTFIVGFPGETDKDVDAIEEFILAGHFAHVGVFTYSQEPESGSYAYPDQIPESEKNARRKRLMKAQQRVLTKRLENYVGRSLRVLIDGAHSESDLLISSRSDFQSPDADGEVIINEVVPTLLSADEALPPDHFRGRFGDVTVTGVAGYDLMGTLVSAA